VTTTALRTCELGPAGITRHQRESSRWEQVSHGLHAPRGTRGLLLSHVDAVARVLRSDAGFGHVTGAALRGWPLPWLPEGLPLFATTAGDLHVQRNGVYVRRARRCPVTRETGVAVLAVPDLLAELARDLALVDLVPVVDAALRTSGLTPDRVLAQIPPRTHGLPRLRRALLLADGRSESYWESVLRLLHVLAGITCVEPQVWVPDRVARGDLWLVGTRRIVEYDGCDHRDPDQHRRDLRRDKALLRIGWERYAYVSREVVSSPGRILRDAEEALGQRHEPARLRRWLTHARVSTLTAHGRALLTARLDRYARAAQRPDR
jgi:very-short-patch-repair endonuclease